MNKETLLLISFLFISFSITAQVSYPYPLQYFSLTVENKKVKMAYMDVAPVKTNGKTMILFHGKNFNGYYWKDLIPALLEKGYRVIVPDQLGWGRSDKPDLHYSFHMLSNNNKLLLDSLKIKKVVVAGHSMGGMLAIRFALMFPGSTEKLVLENPIGLEDYKTFVPYQPLEKIYAKESAATYETYKKYQQSYYPEWKTTYEQYVQAQAEVLTDTAFRSIAWVNAVTYQMIYEQPVVYELDQIIIPTLLIIGQSDRTMVGKDLLNEVQKNKHGQYPKLGKMAHKKIVHSKLVELNGTGHIPHIQHAVLFKQALLPFLDAI
ncbi:MAG: alpha/beta hydrolase [Ferruginibacter sp.]|nr:alpha/beta hydrolase [Ferruginibacter sp.]